MSTRRRKLVTANESALIAKSILDAAVVEDGQCDGCLADPSSADESNRCQVFCQTNDLFDQLTTPETRPWPWGR